MNQNWFWTKTQVLFKHFIETLQRDKSYSNRTKGNEMRIHYNQITTTKRSTKSVWPMIIHTQTSRKTKKKKNRKWWVIRWSWKWTKNLQQMYLEMLPTSKICWASSYVMPCLLACEPFFKIKFCCLSFENENSSSKRLLIFFSHFNFLSPVFILLFPHSSLPDILFFLLTSSCKLCTIFLKIICLSGSSSLSLTIFPVFFFNPPTP